MKNEIDSEVTNKNEDFLKEFDNDRTGKIANMSC